MNKNGTEITIMHEDLVDLKITLMAIVRVLKTPNGSKLFKQTVRNIFDSNYENPIIDDEGELIKIVSEFTHNNKKQHTMICCFNKTMLEVYNNMNQRIAKDNEGKIDKLTQKLLKEINIDTGKTLSDPTLNIKSIGHAYTDVLGTLGEWGEEVATKLNKTREMLTLAFWWPEPSLGIFSKKLAVQSTAVKGLLKAIWLHAVKPVGATTYAISKGLVKAQGHSILAIAQQNKVELYHNDQMIADTPTISTQLIPQIMKNQGLVKSKTAHTLIRYLIEKGFTQYKMNKFDYRTLTFEGGYTEFAEVLGLKSCNDIVKLRELVETLSNIRYITSKVNSFLIALTEHKNKNTNRKEALKIVISDVLLPQYTHKEKDGLDSLLVPCVQLPPMVGSYNTHAKQCQLQMETLLHMTENSNEFATEGGVKILPEDFKRMNADIELSPKMLTATVGRWGEDDGKFLEAVGKDTYKLGKDYAAAQKHFDDQGILRLLNSERGKKSVQKKMKRLKNPKIKKK